MIELKAIVKSFGRTMVLDSLSLEASRESITLLMGGNGTGKSTALRIAAGAMKADAGTVAIDGAAADPAERRRRTAYLPQSAAFQPKLSPLRVLRFYARVFGRNVDAIDAALHSWGLSPHARKPSGKLSGGMRQRLGLAVMTLTEAPALLLDEPGLSLDPEWRARMQAWLRERATAGCAVLVATHLPAEWRGRVDAARVFEHGRAERAVGPDRLGESATR